jgi:hypothetical protein
MNRGLSGGALTDLYLGDALATALYHVGAGPDSAPVGYEWDPRSRRYRSTDTGHFMSSMDVRAGLESVINGVQQELDDLAAQAAGGTLDPKAFRDAMEAQLAVLHQTAALAGTGGIQAQDVAALNAIAEHTRGELDYLDGFAEDMARAEAEGKAMTDSEISNHAGQYATAARPIYEGARQEAVLAAADKVDEGVDVGRRVLMPEADHCEPCVALGVNPDDRGGYIRVVAIVPIGKTPCRGNCQCTIEYANTRDLDPDQYDI